MLCVEVNITRKLWEELNLVFIPPQGAHPQAVFLDMGLRYLDKEVNTHRLHYGVHYEVVDKDKFFLSVLKYGIEYEEIKCSV